MSAEQQPGDVRQVIEREMRMVWADAYLYRAEIDQRPDPRGIAEVEARRESSITHRATAATEKLMSPPATERVPGTLLWQCGRGHLWHAVESTPCAVCANEREVERLTRELAEATSPSAPSGCSVCEQLREFVARERALRDSITKGGQHVGRSPTITPSVLKELERTLATEVAPSGWQPHLTVADLHVEPEDRTSAIESHDVHFTVGDVSLLVNVQGGAGFSWALNSRDGKINEHGSRNTDDDGAYRAPSGWQQRIAAMNPWKYDGHGEAACHFCDVTRYREDEAHKLVEQPHEADCLWQNAKDALSAAGSPILAFQAWAERRTSIRRPLTQDEYFLAQEAFFAAHPGKGPTSSTMDAVPPVDVLDDIRHHLTEAWGALLFDPTKMPIEPLKTAITVAREQVDLALKLLPRGALPPAPEGSPASVGYIGGQPVRCVSGTNTVAFGPVDLPRCSGCGEPLGNKATLCARCYAEADASPKEPRDGQ